MMMNLKFVILLFLLVVLVLGVAYVYLNPLPRFKEGFCDSMTERFVSEHFKSPDSHLVATDGLQYQQPSITHGRTDIVSLTPWLAPIVWEGTFNPVLLDSVYQKKNISIAVTVFAVGKYIMFMKDFLETAEQHFFVGFRVHVHVFTDRPNEVPKVKMADGRELSVHSVPNSKRWQEISARRMEMIQKLIEEKLKGDVDYIFCLDVDSKFHGRWGTESLGELVAVIHPGYYRDHRGRFPYERRSASRAYMAPDEGDFYYCGGAFGGLLKEVHQLAQTCRKNFEDDAKEGIEAAWQEESHLNRYMWINKPSKVLSPEYLWQDFKPRNPEILIIRFSGVVKNYNDIRPN
ncbi:globoside alpha-1,3-N-acetylgalactosaminyltransferase 1 isoform X1 [Fundulus heteroclitus]|uniref:globoside alpha-1,3-N-acetylgalactosaminyltransferase 1 isoform X1 n=1 Tax=Fundulus heteroclitus TaxID=8078 RepID=UPI00165AF6B9|nr:globoside alpha-1,3-N-acetylgalactosaminyltransferase 1 isoform X1 [Fundulus heteroclitus]XP_036004049.1 globoside alpha-1,3-N-acetylgalactosaminyltransferase 1 isoform X1 [Fundulus heteroclitus]XP_036004050.1 globoside alpha-1,3-N-acetylgalactosaminyltransferase 1 isoform X1 [Fundulus heteroclitus]XP_036004051.1 globoside alpha-1,3-N-acetylgalactosaminyltransferase 1 isoform X1 [Fundulus heteroclitus]